VNITPEIIALFDSACRAKTTLDATLLLEEVASERMRQHPDDDLATAEAWARRAICYWAGYFTHTVRLRVEKVYGCEHPCFGAATRGPMDPTQAFCMGLNSDHHPNFPWPVRPPPYPDEP
jgi:hypothetical protein